MKIPARVANTSWIFCLLLCCLMYLFVVFIVYFLTLMEYPIVSFAFCCLDLCIFLSFSVFPKFVWTLVFLQVCISYIMYLLPFIVLTRVSLCRIHQSFSEFVQSTCLYLFPFLSSLMYAIVFFKVFFPSLNRLHISNLSEMIDTSTNSLGYLQTIFHTMCGNSLILLVNKFI